MNKRGVMVLTAVAVAGGALTLARKGSARAPEPDYEVLGQRGGLELRRYGPLVIAETEVEGDLHQASQDGFQRLAGYIFGANNLHEKIEMTAPVTMAEASGHFAMTFIMPVGSTVNTLPRPRDHRVHLRALPARDVAVLSFSGRVNPELLADKRAELDRRLADAGLPAAGAVELAQYNPPWILGPWRRNELMVPLAGEPTR